MKLTDILGEEWQVDCMGCAMGEGRMTPPGGIIAENDTFYMHQDPLVPWEGFLVLAARRHVRSLAELTEAEHADFAALSRLARQVLRLVPDARAFTLVQEEASSHLHFWFFPWLDEVVERWGDTSLGHVRPAMEEAMRAPSTPERRARVLDWAERARQAAGRKA